jgi:hypothetical protein
MGDERRIGRVVRRAGRRAVPAALALAAAVADAPAARAQSGFLQVQFERSETQFLRQLDDSTLVGASSIQSYWTQNYQLNHALLPNPGTSLTWQLGFQDRQAVDRVERTQTPYGNLRLTRPTVGLYASVRPVTLKTTAQVAVFPGAPLGGVPTEEVRQHATQSVLSAYLADPRLPRVDVSWTRDQRDQPGLSQRRYDDRRDARVSHNLGRVNLRAAYGDLARGTEAFNGEPYQRTLGAGTGIVLNPRAGMDLRLDYDYSTYDRRAEGRLRTDTRTHRGTVNGTWAQSRTLSWSLFSWLQRSQQPTRGRADQDNAEGQLFLAWQPDRRTRVQTGAQIRRAARGTETGTERIALATASWGGDVRHGWSATGDVSQSVTWSEFRSPFGMSTARLGSRMRLQEGIHLSLDLQGAVNNDTVAVSRAVTQGSAGLVLVPLRGLQTTLRGTAYRVGPGFDRVTSTSRTGELDLRWTPWQDLQINGNLRRQVSGPVVRTASTTQTAYVRWMPGTMVQLNLSYSSNRLDDARAAAASNLRREREIVSVQGAWALDRSKQLTAEASVLEPNQDRQANAYNASFTWRFGR